MARYQGKVAVFRATVPLGVKTPDCEFEPNRPSSTSSRRRSGRNSASCRPSCARDEAVHPPGVPRHHRHAADAEAGAGVRRRQGRRRSATSWSISCSRRRSTPTSSPTSGPTSSASSAGNQPSRAQGTFAFHNWIREAIASDKPYDEFVRDILGGHRRRVEEPADGVVQGAADSPSSSWTTPPRCSSACGWRVPSATTTRTRSGARTTTGAWPRSSAASAARTMPIPGGRPEPGRTGRSIFTKSSGSVHEQADRASRPRCKPLDGEPMDVERRRRPAAEAGRLDGRPEEPVLRPGRRQPLLGALLRPRHRRSARRHARHQPAVQPRTARRAGQGPGRQQVQPEAPGQDDLQEPDVPAQRDAERVQQARQAELRPLLPEAAWRPRCCSTRSAR